MIELRVIARLLDYPTSEVVDHAPELQQILLDCPLLSFRLKARLASWLGDFAATDLMDLQEAYGGLFDRGRSTSLLMFEHVHGESRDRGQAMVDLMALYQSHGFDDRMPGSCRTTSPCTWSTCPIAHARKQRTALLDVAHILALVGARLEDRGSGYGLLLFACHAGSVPGRSHGR